MTTAVIDLSYPAVEIPAIAPVSYIQTPVPVFDFKDPPVDPMEVCRILYQSKARYPCLGLAANQLGLPYRALIFGMPDSEDYGILFNPTIVFHSGTQIGDEGCISFPGILLRIERPQEIRVRYQNVMAGGVTHTSLFTGLTARIICHEIDHLNGIDFRTLVSKLKQTMVRKKLRKMKRQ
jgi:peptide deformylase